MMMASRLIYGLAQQDVLPRTLGQGVAEHRAPYAGIIFSTLLALGLIIYVSENAESDVVVNLASVTALLLLGVFTSSTSPAWCCAATAASRCSARPAPPADRRARPACS